MGDKNPVLDPNQIPVPSPLDNALDTTGSVTPPATEDVPPPPSTQPVSDTVVPETIQPPPTPPSPPAVESILPPQDEGAKKSKAKIIGVIAGVIILLASVAAGVILVEKNQELREKAAETQCPAGTTPQCIGYALANGTNATCYQGTTPVTDVCLSSCGSCTPESEAGTHPDGCARPTDTVQCLSAEQQKEMRNRGFNAVCYTAGGNPAESIKISENRCPISKHADGCTGYGDTVQCLDDNQKKEARNIGFNAVCYSGDKPAESIKVSDNRCGAVYQTPAAGSHPDGCAKPDDRVQCLDQNQQKEARNRGFNAVCYTKASNYTAPAESVKIAENRCPLYKHPDGCTGYGDNVQCLDETQKKENRNIGFNAVCYSGDKPAESILVSNTRCGAPYSPAGSNMLSISNVTPNPVTYGQPVKFKATFSGPNAAKIHVRIWPNDAPGVTAMDGGKITTSGQEITFDTSRFPTGTTTARVRFQLQNSSDADIKPDVAQDVTLTINAVAGGANATLCTTIELIKNNSIVFESSPGNNPPIINQGESFQIRVMCTTTDSADNFDKIQVKITAPSGSSTQEIAARRFQERDRGSSRAFFAIFDLTTTSVGNYSIKAWGHTPTKGWKGRE